MAIGGQSPHILPTQGRIQKAQLGGESWVEKGVRDAKGVEGGGFPSQANYRRSGERRISVLSKRHRTPVVETFVVMEKP